MTTTQTKRGYTLRFTTSDGPQRQQLRDEAAVERFGDLLNRRNRKSGNRAYWDIAVHDQNGHDVTFDFDCFCT